ncbi:MAG: glycosyltransferase family 39 protein [Pleurocapsa sp. MO_192.B19]|nr:glycosyltransferase family 39 protein [Pleurocapsa sp. MO_192.B19]
MLDSLNTSSLSQTTLSRLLKYLALFFVLFGILVRLIQYLNNRSLWLDEASLALNIINRSYGELAQTLDHNQAAPLGFLWLEKLSTQIWGNNEYALRLLPFIASILALGVFYRLVCLYSSTLAAPIAIALFACGRYTLYFATEVKPYSSDVALALILFWLLTKVRYQILQIREILGFALLGSLVIWFSYPSIFILGGLEGCYLLTASRKHLRQILTNRIPIYLTWVCSFALFYFLTIASTLNNEDLSSSWEDRYPDSFGDIIWLFDALGRFFYHPMGFSGITDGIGIIAFIFGCIAWYRYNRTMFLALISPFVATIIAAYLHKYPFRDRLVLFLAPMGMLIVAEGIIFLLLKFRNSDGRWRKFISRSDGTANSSNNSFKNNFLMGLLGIIGIICLWTLIISTVFRAGNFVIHPELKHEIKPVVEYVVSEDQPGDKIYVYNRAIAAFTYYVEQRGYSDLDYITGAINFSNKDRNLSEKWQALNMEIKPFQGISRVWFILREDHSEELEILQYLNQIGQQIDSFPQPGASAYLYNFNNFR